MASLAGARRTQSSYPVFLASTNPSDVTMAVYAATANGSAGPSLVSGIKRVRGVRDVVSIYAPPFIPLTPSGVPEISKIGSLVMGGSVDGMLSTQDSLGVVSGRLLNPRRADEVVMTASAARILHVRVGQIVPLGLFTNAQFATPGFGTPRVKPRILAEARVTGIVVINTLVVQDDVDQTYGFVLLSPALIREVIREVDPHATPALYGIQLTPHHPPMASIERNLIGVVPRGYVYEFHNTARVTSTVELALKPESVALGAFGVIAALICLILAAQAIWRQIRVGNEDRQVMRALGASPSDIMAEGLIGVLGAVIVGTVVAAVAAILLSPLAPLGPVRPVYPGAGVHVDVAVVGLGAAVLVVVLGAFAVTLALREAPHRVSGRRPASPRPSRITQGARAAGLPVAGVVGVHLALESGRGRTAVPVRSVLLGTVVAISLVVTTLTFASGMSTLLSRPPLYGWNWDFALSPSNNVPTQSTTLLNHDPKVTAWVGVEYTNAELDGQAVPVIIEPARSTVAPPILSGHGLTANNQIVLGAATLAQLHAKIGDVVSFSIGNTKDARSYIAPTPLTVVGTATFPAVGYSSYVAEHTAMGVGALVPDAIFPPKFQGTHSNPDPNLNGPELVFVRLRPGVGAATGRADMERIATVGNKIFAKDPNAHGNIITVLGVQRPAQIVNYRAIGSTPLILAGGLSVGALVALGLTLAASVRRRRRDLALLKVLGFTHRQLASAVAWQATVDATLGLVTGIPIGILVGRELWTLFANSINAVPDPSVPTWSIVVVAVGALLFANLVAAVPGRSAARTPTALILRAE